MADLIEQIAFSRSIASEYISAANEKIVIPRESKIECLRALGYDVDNEANLANQYNQEQDKLFSSGVEPVVVAFENQTIETIIRLSSNEFNNTINYVIALEDGSTKEGSFNVDHATRSYARTVNGVEYVEFKSNISNDLPLGYHDLTFKTADREFTTRLINCPLACFKQKRVAEGEKVWGPSIQLYTLRSEKNWGIGDFGDLATLIGKLADNGAGFIGVNPIHAAYPSNPEEASPYSPSSRRWLNTIYINVELAQEFKENKDAQKLVKSKEFQARLEALRETEYVSYAGVMEAKLEVLKKIFAEATKLKDGRANRGKQFKKFVKEGGLSLQQMATYDALMEQFYGEGEIAWGWPVWKKEYQSFESGFVKNWAKEHESEVEFYMYLQFLADEQLEAAHNVAKEKNMAVGIYRDLAVGCSIGSEEIWANGDNYCVDASIGCPPDPLGPLGQNWGLPPLDPAKLIEKKYEPIIELFRANMRHCGSLRIDHAMSLLRLWWVPPRASATKGAYVYYRVREMIGILALESHRNECLIIGEDLGTVPAEMKTILKETGIHSYKIFFWEKSETDGGYISPKDYVEQAMSTLSTHDMPTIEGWWSHSDLQLGKSLGLYNDDNVHQLGEARYIDQQRILDSLHWNKVIPESISRDARNCPMSPELRNGMQVHMCLGNCALFSTQLEDWIGMEKPVNVPGTSREYPNWRRKLSKNISEIFADKTNIELCKAMTAARKEASNK